MPKSTKFFIFLFAVLFILANSTFEAAAQRRDHLTAAEIELVRDAQRIDERIKIFVRAVERRFQVINNAAASKPEKDEDKWGAMPTGTRRQLLLDIERLLDEAVSKIDDAALRDYQSDYFSEAVHLLADAAGKFQPELKMQLDKSTDEKERGAILGAIEFCDQIIEASAKIKRESPKEIKKRKEKEAKEKSKNSGN